MKIKRKLEDVYLDFKKDTKNKIKMKAGAPRDIFNDINFKQIFLEKCEYISSGQNGKKFKVMYRKVNNQNLILFGNDLMNYNSKNYLPYIYYLNNDQVKFKQISISNYFSFQDITFEYLQQNNLILLLLNEISNPDTKQNYFYSNKRNQNFRILVNKLIEKIQMQQPQMQQLPQQMQQQYQPLPHQMQQQMPQQYQPQMQQPYQQQLPQQMQQQMQQPYQQQLPQQMQQQMQQQFQEKSPQNLSQNKINELKQQLGTLINTQKLILEEIAINPINTNKLVLQKLTQTQETLKKSINNELLKIDRNPITETIQKEIKNNQKAELQKLSNYLKTKRTEIENIQKKQIFNITKQNSNDRFSKYRCDDTSLEVKIQGNNIFFDYDENLFIKSQDGSYKFYYKYSYDNVNFMKLNKKPNGTFEEKLIDINLIPTYDILCIYTDVKDLRSRTELLKKLNERIEIAKRNISKTAEAFLTLDHSNFNKQERNQKIKILTSEQKEITNGKYKNFGKVKKRMTKTYIFFGTTGAYNTKIGERESSIWFDYVCFREDDKVFYYAKSNLKEKIPLFKFPFIFPLEDLISFILLRRMITNDKKFADNIYNEATLRIKFLKTQKIADKMLINQYPENYHSFPGKPLRATQQLIEQTSILPRSSPHNLI
jgi:hypothetical protein